MGFCARCGISDPGIEATPRSNNKIKAVRILVSCRQAKRAKPTAPISGTSTSLSYFIRSPEKILKSMTVFES